MFGVVNNKTGTAFNSRLTNETKIFQEKQEHLKLDKFQNKKGTKV
jgi:hypothetical protein